MRQRKQEAAARRPGKPDISFAIEACVTHRTPVSYTHLDVYKRQGNDVRDDVRSELDQFIADKYPDARAHTRLITTCLLYTSLEEAQKHRQEAEALKEYTKETNNPELQKMALSLIHI